MAAEIRSYLDADWPAVWQVIQEVASAGDTFTYPTNINEALARTLWIQAAPGHTVVAAAADGRLLGTAKMGPNQMGPGSHIATASFMVADHARGRGIGRLLGNYSIAWAEREGYRSMQFNAVVASNSIAVGLWKSLGFVIIGTVPEGFNHPEHGFVGLHVMYRSLITEPAKNHLPQRTPT